MSDLRARLRGGWGPVPLDVDVVASGGAVTALVGGSGAGKTTLLRAIAGLVRLDGEVWLGADAWQAGESFTAPHRRRAGLVFQHGALLPHLSVAGNLAYAERRAAGEAVLPRAEAVALLGVEPLLMRAPAMLSGGERRRVAVARALLARPRVLLLDEPLAGLDAEARDALLPRLKAVLARLAIPVLYVSHDRAEVARLADRVLALEDGRLSDVTVADTLDGRTPQEIAALARAALHAGLTAEA